MALRSARRGRIGAVVVLVAALSGLMGGLGATTAHAGASGVPYTDTSAIGSIALCNRAGHEMTQGSVDTKPFVWRAVSSVAANSPYNKAGRTAVLYAFQPRRETPAGDWSGEGLTAAGRYTNPAHPMTAATRLDEPLKAFVSDFPPMWDGLIQIRMYLGGPGLQYDSFTYPAINLKITGNTWHVVGAAAADTCGSGRSESVARLLLPALQSTPSSAPSAGSLPSASTSNGASPSGGSSPSGSSPTSGSATAGSGHHHGGIAGATGRSQQVGRSRRSPGAASALSAGAATPDASTSSARARAGGHSAVTLAVVIALAIFILLGGGIVASRRIHPQHPEKGQ